MVMRAQARCCDHVVRLAIWCHDPACCPQDPAVFLAGLASIAEQTGRPAVAVRPDSPGDLVSAATPVTVWQPGSSQPVFAGPNGAASVFALAHDCPGRLP